MTRAVTAENSELLENLSFGSFGFSLFFLFDQSFCILLEVVEANKYDLTQAYLIEHTKHILKLKWGTIHTLVFIQLSHFILTMNVLTLSLDDKGATRSL